MDNFVLDKMDSALLKSIADLNDVPTGAFSLRKNGQSVKVNTTPNVNILRKQDKPGIDIYVRADTKGETVHIPVVITESGITDVVYNDFYIGKNADVIINAGCGIHNDGCKDTHHNGVHRFFLDEGAKVLYVEKHYGEGEGDRLRDNLLGLKHLHRQDGYNPKPCRRGRNPADEDEEPDAGRPPERRVPVPGEGDEHRKNNEGRHVERSGKKRSGLSTNGPGYHGEQDETKEGDQQFGSMAAVTFQRHGIIRRKTQYAVGAVVPRR